MPTVIIFGLVLDYAERNLGGEKKSEEHGPASPMLVQGGEVQKVMIRDVRAYEKIIGGEFSSRGRRLTVRGGEQAGRVRRPAMEQDLSIPRVGNVLRAVLWKDSSCHMQKRKGRTGESDV